MRYYNEFNKRSERINIKNDKKYSEKDYVLRDEIGSSKFFRNRVKYKDKRDEKR